MITFHGDVAIKYILMKCGTTKDSLQLPFQSERTSADSWLRHVTIHHRVTFMLKSSTKAI